MDFAHKVSWQIRGDGVISSSFGVRRWGGENHRTCSISSDWYLLPTNLIQRVASLLRVSPFYWC